MPPAAMAAITPASVSPEPAVASQGGALSLTARRPSGAAIKVLRALQEQDGTALFGRQDCPVGPIDLVSLQIGKQARELALNAA
jgi:hypothetical protein